MCGSQGVGFAPRALVQSGWPPPGRDKEMGGYFTRDTGADHTNTDDELALKSAARAIEPV